MSSSTSGAAEHPNRVLWPPAKDAVVPVVFAAPFEKRVSYHLIVVESSRKGSWRFEMPLPYERVLSSSNEFCCRKVGLSDNSGRSGANGWEGRKGR